MIFFPDDFQNHIKFANNNIIFWVCSALPTFLTLIFAPDWKVSVWIVLTISIIPLYLLFYLLSFYFYCAKNEFNSNRIQPITASSTKEGIKIIANSIILLGRGNRVDFFYIEDCAENYICSGNIEGLTSRGHFQIVLQKDTFADDYLNNIDLMLNNNKHVLKNIIIKPAVTF